MGAETSSMQVVMVIEFSLCGRHLVSQQKRTGSSRVERAPRMQHFAQLIKQEIDGQ